MRRADVSSSAGRAVLLSALAALSFLFLPVGTAAKARAGADAGALRCWRLETSGARLEWTARWAGTPVTGGFARFDADIRFSPDALDRSRIRVRVPIGSLIVRDSDVRDLLVGEDWLAPDRFPEAVYEGTRVAKRGANGYRLRGILTLKGISRPLDIDFSLAVAGDRAHAEGGAVIDRRAFGVGGGALDAATAATVDVRFAFDARAVDCPAAPSSGS